MHIGFIGLGSVGAKLATSLLRHNYQVTVRDLDEAAGAALRAEGASWAASGEQLGRECDVVVTCLPSPAVSADVMEAADGVLHGLTPGTIWLEMSTTDEDEVKRLGAKVKAVGGFAVDCPVSVDVTRPRRATSPSSLDATAPRSKRFCRC